MKYELGQMVLVGRTVGKITDVSVDGFALNVYEVTAWNFPRWVSEADILAVVTSKPRALSDYLACMECDDCGFCQATGSDVFGGQVYGCYASKCPKKIWEV